MKVLQKKYDYNTCILLDINAQYGISLVLCKWCLLNCEQTRNLALTHYAFSATLMVPPRGIRLCV